MPDHIISARDGKMDRVMVLLAIRFFLKLINRIKLVPFAVYRIVLAGVIFFML